MAELTPLFMDVNDVYSGDELGLPYRDIVSEGVVNPAGGGLLVSEKAGGANLSVDVAIGSCWVKGDTDTLRQPTYRCLNDAVVNKGITPDGTNPRRVRVVAQVTDQTFTGSGRKWEILAIHGTPAGSPTLPALPDSAISLADILVAAADTAITNGEITDLRSAAAFGGSSVAKRIILTPGAAALPDGSSGNLAPGLSRRQGTEANPKKHFFTLDFDGAGAKEHAWWTFPLPQDYISAGTLRILWQANATANSCKWQARIAATTAGDADTHLEHAGSSLATVTTATNATEARRGNSSIITLNTDSMAPGDLVTLLLMRDSVDAADTLTVDAEVTGVILEY